MSIYFYSEFKKLKEHFSNSDIQYPKILEYMTYFSVALQPY